MRFKSTTIPLRRRQLLPQLAAGPRARGSNELRFLLAAGVPAPSDPSHHRNRRPTLDLARRRIAGLEHLQMPATRAKRQSSVHDNVMTTQFVLPVIVSQFTGLDSDSIERYRICTWVM